MKQMVRVTFVFWSWTFVVTTLANVTCAATTDAARPNVVIIMADDLGYRDLSCYGCTDFSTPNIDALASRGIRFTDGYVSHPYCSPSRAGLLSGKYQQSFGHEHNPPYDESNHEIGIDVKTKLLPSILAEVGYKTGLIGKWHLGAGEPFRPARRGFDEFYGFLGGGHHYFNALANGNEYDGPMWRGKRPTSDQLTYLTDDLTTEGEQFIDLNKDKPFCLLMMYNAPHAPDHVTDRYLQRVATIKHPGRRKYAALVQGVDEGVKRIAAKLAQHRLSQNTLVIFLSDNGGRGQVSDNRPLRGNKGWLHDGGIRVPLIISLPGKLAQGNIYHQPVSALDILPTALQLAGVDVPSDCDGVDLMPFLTKEKRGRSHATLYWRVCGGKGFAIRDGDWKLVHDVGMKSASLYDLSKDIGEDNNLADQFPEKIQTLNKKYWRWSQQLETPRWTERHYDNTVSERSAARKAGARQLPMPWVNASKN